MVLKKQFGIFVMVFVMVFLFASFIGCGDDDDDADDDSTSDDDITDDDETGSAPVLSNPLAFPGVPVGPDGALNFKWNLCDADGDINSDAMFQVFDSLTDQAVSPQFPFVGDFSDYDITDCGSSFFYNLPVLDVNTLSPGEYSYYLIVWDAAGNESEPLTGFTFWVPDDNDEGPIVTNADIAFTPIVSEFILSFNICDEEDDLDGGYATLMTLYTTSSGNVAPWPFMDPTLLSLSGYVSGEADDCGTPAEFLYSDTFSGLDAREHCPALLVLDGQQNPSDLVEDICFTVE